MSDAPRSVHRIARGARLSSKRSLKGVLAAECIADLGLSRTSSHEIVRRSGYTWGGIQHNFGTYNAVLFAVMETASAGLREMLSEPKLDESASTSEQVTAVADVVWDYVRRPESLGYLEIYLYLPRDPEASAATREAIRAFDVDVEQVWRSAMQRHFGDAIADAPFQRILFATMRGLAVSRWLNDGRPNFATERRIFADLLAGYVENGAPR